MIFLFVFIKPNLYFILGSKSVEVILPVAIASLIEGHWRTYILSLFVIRFNPSKVYALLYGDPTYGDIYIFLYFG